MGFFHYLCNTIINKHKVMKVLAIFKNQMYSGIFCLRFKNEDEVFKWWSFIPCSEEFELLSIINLERTGHKYDLKYTKKDEDGSMLTKNICVYSKKQATFAKELIEEEFPNIYKFQITKTY